MILPTTYLGSLLLLVTALICLGTWAVLHKFTFKWRFEVFYYDVTWGILIAALIAAFTLGSMNEQELTFQDNMLLTGYRKVAWIFAAGAVYNLANILLLASVTASRLALGFPVALGLSLVIGGIWDFASGSRGSAVLIFGGAVALLAAIIIHVFASHWHADDQVIAAQKAMTPDPRTRQTKPPVPASSATGVFLAVVSGVLFGLASPMITEATTGDNGISAYGGMLLFSGGVFLSSLLYVPFFLNFPVQGEPLQLRAYFKGTKKSHLLGLIAGMMVAAGILAQLVAASAIPSVQAGPVLAYVLAGSVAVLATLWGLFVVREFKGATSRTQMAVLAGAVVFLLGVSLIGFGRAAK